VLGTMVALAIALFTTRSTAREILARIRAQQQVTDLNTRLEQRVAQRTRELTEANATLAAEIEERKHAEEQYREEAAARLLVQAELARSEQRMNFALQAAEIGLWDWDILTGEQTWSEMAKNLIGLPVETPANFESLMAAVHPDFREKMWAAINQAIADNKDFVFEFSTVSPDGSLHWQVSKGRAFYDEKGRATRMAGVVINIDRRKAAEDRLRLQATALEAAANAIVITDPQGTIVRANPAFTAMTGYSLSEAIGANPRILASGKHDKAFYRNLWATISAGKVWRGEIMNRRKDGTFYNEEMTITPVISERGKITNYVAIKQEVTGRKRLEEHLRQAQKLEAIGQLAAGIAHEINTPAQYVRDNTTFLKESWTSLGECVSLLRKAETGNDDVLKQFAAACRAADLEYLEREIPQAIEQSREGIERISKIVLAMKEFSHPGSAEKVPVDLNKAIDSTITVARSEWKYVAEMETRLDPQLPRVPCHVGEIKQVVLNFLTNAAYAIHQVVKDSGQKGKIAVTTAHAGDFIEISVADTGPGIPEEIQSRIFEYFFTTKPVGSGTGQGLAMAHNSIVKRHGGKIWFETAAGKGTTFFIRLPLKTAEEVSAKAAGSA
jgi:two-component system, NtrC family, sensor kinase